MSKEVSLGSTESTATVDWWYLKRIAKKEESLGRNNVKFLLVQSTETELASPSVCSNCVVPLLCDGVPIVVSEKVDVGENLPTLRVLRGRLH
jgi:hypothetical protein